MKEVLTQVDDPNIVLEKIVENFLIRKQPKPSKLKPPVKLYNNYSDFTRETFIDRMLENPQEHGLVARDLDINYRIALRWWNCYKGTEEVAYKKSE